MGGNCHSERNDVPYIHFKGVGGDRITSNNKIEREGYYD